MNINECHRVLIIADIHANAAALDAVLDEAAYQFDAVWCLGDLVGYGPDPNHCVARVKTLPRLICLLGNHDKAAVGDVDIHIFNPDARAAMLWTQNSLTAQSRSFLGNLESLARYQGVTMTHGSPRDPVWEYVTNDLVATQNFFYFETPLCLVGHSHVPLVFRLDEGECSAYIPRQGKPVDLKHGRHILNPGSVGQPRDGNPMASYALLDLDANTWELRRVPYSLVDTQQRMEFYGLPGYLVARLAAGI